MKRIGFKYLLLSLLAVAFAVLGIALSEQPGNKMDMLAGHFSREGNNDSPSKTTKNNIYIKLYKDQWIALLHIPYPYATTVEPAAIDKVFTQIKKQASSRAYLRGTFGQLEEKATAQVEKFGYMEDRLVFECGSLAPCTIKLGDGYLELIKPGVINEHIIKYNHVVAQ